MEQLLHNFTSIYGGSIDDLRLFFAPGRVNLIGEHTDYNGGHVLPCALQIGTYLVIRQREDNKINLYSKNFEEVGTISVTLENLSYNKEHDWANYPKGIIAEMNKSQSFTQGFDAMFFGDIPNGAGLSSSASIELVTAVMVNEVYQLNVDRIPLVKLSQKVENQYIGVNCGIMDQFAIGMGKEDQAILLNCDTLDYQYLPMELQNNSIVIANTNKMRGLADSAYNERRATCDGALQKLQAKLSISSLGELSLAQFEEYKELLSDEEILRVRHAVSENERTLKAVTVLKAGDLTQFGELMKASHLSLRDDYEVSCMELDTLVEAAWKHEGTIGARMTGAGFGGCTVNIVNNEHIDSFIEQVGTAYKEKVGYEASFYVVGVGCGAKELNRKEQIQ
ncbi:galactokinase [Bacillus pinisoli]|uniref:galactokinase n=1 Tax=Bacillus pinisoli TaxID=2901866 RepID=UPI001FF4082A|nr:galactokinase [Bacillus pinisoli]